MSPAAAAIRPRTVILVHGIWMTGLEMQWLARGLRRAGGWRTLTFRYPSVRVGLVENARRLAAFCAAVEARDGGQPAHLVGHSLGGIVVWRMALDHPQRAGGPAGRVVTLGAPFGGSRLARHVLARGGRRLGPLLVGRTYREEGAGEWPAERAWPRAEAGGRELGVLAGQWPFGVGHLLGALPLPNDGVVALDETPVAGAADYRVLGVNHVALTLAPEAIRQTAHFLEHGRFGERGDFASDP